MVTNFRIDELRRRVDNDPASIAFAQLAEEYRRAGAYDEAARVCRAGLERHPTYLSARVTLGRALLELDRYDEAQAELELVLRSAPENLAAVRALAEVHQRRGNLAEALRQYQIALALSKHDPELEEAVLDLNRRLGSGAARSEAASDPEPGRAGVRRPDAPRPLAGEPAVTPLASLSPDLEAAADEFTRALQALDALALDLPESPPFLEDEPIAREDAGPPTAASPETEPVLEAPPFDRQADEAVVGELESWLDAILRDRAERAKRRAASDAPDLSTLPDLPVNSRS